VFHLHRSITIKGAPFFHGLANRYEQLVT